MLKEQQAQQGAHCDASANGHASVAEDEDRPKPCVPKGEQIREHSSAADSAGSADSTPEKDVAVPHCRKGDGSTGSRAFRMEWDFSQHAKYPVMRLKQTGRSQ